jgi:hypothetical protein
VSSPPPTQAEQDDLLRRAQAAAAELHQLAAEARSAAQNTTLEGRQTFSIDPTPQQLRAASQQHRQLLQIEEQRHQRGEATKDNELRRFAFQVVLFALLVVLAVAFYLAIASDNATTRAWAQGLISTLIGALGGGVLGYFTGKSGK